MVKHTQTISSAVDVELFKSVWPFCGVVLKGLRTTVKINIIINTFLDIMVTVITIIIVIITTVIIIIT